MEELKPILDQLTEIIKGTKEFTMAQAPEFIKQYLIKSFISEMVDLVLSAIILIACFYWYKKLRNNWDYLDEECFFGSAAIFIGSILGSLGVFISAQNILIIWLSPKVWIVENLVSSIIKK